MRKLSVLLAAAVCVALLSAPAVAAAPKVLWGRSTYYASRYVGQTMACGGRYRHRKMIAAVDLALPVKCGKTLMVKNRANGRKIAVTVADRCSCPGRTIIDLSKRAARKLRYVSAGWTQVRVKVLPAA
ncbi:MAG TPA: septal ring lytic transglycosylase RlpA family protein [Actinomycetota bacterium]|nr:septal ring lytic transglycosylase RlpA family protein [Actinomycetota bacterium]